MSSDGKSVLFRKAFHGYDSDDVNNYISEMNISFSAKENDYREQIRELTDSNQQLSALVSDYQSIIASLEDEITMLRNEQTEDENHDITSAVPDRHDEPEADPVLSESGITEAASETVESPFDVPEENAGDAVKIRENAEVLSRLMLERTKRSLLSVSSENQHKFNDLALEANESFGKLLLELRVKIKDLQLSEEDALEKIRTAVIQTIDEVFPKN